MSTIRITASDGETFPAYLARPSETPAPGIVLLQEVYGVNRFMRAIADHWARQGFLVAAPALYWRMGDIELDPETPGHREQALETRKGLSEDEAVADTLAAAHHLRGMDECTGKVATMGYCLGGLLAYLAAVRGDTDANVSFYGVGIEQYLDEATKLDRPLMLHIGEIDPYTPEAVCQATEAALAGRADVAIHLYPGTGHAFAREGATADVPEMRELANGRTLKFLREHLG